MRYGIKVQQNYLVSALKKHNSILFYDTGLPEDDHDWVKHVAILTQQI